MGRRHERHKFMPGKYVFPGGRLDYADTRAPAVGDLDRDVEARLVTNTRAGMDARRARALALAAIRETFEETGLAIGVPQNGDHGISRSLAWRDFHKCGLTPRLDGLQFIARAITPPGRVQPTDG